MSDETKPIISVKGSNSDYGTKDDVATSDAENEMIIPTSRETAEYNLFGGASSHLDFPGSIIEVCNTSKSSQHVTCRVCKGHIDITDKREQFVVKCNICNEATPIQNPPAGKKYVRCPCNCLLVCKVASQRIACPRVNCKRIINLATDATPAAPTRPSDSEDMKRVVCVHCDESFLFDTTHNALAQCPHCRKISSVGTAYSCHRAMFYLCMAIICLLTSGVIVWGTLDQARQYPGYFVLYAAFFLVCMWLLWRFKYYSLMKASSCPDRDSV